MTQHFYLSSDHGAIAYQLQAGKHPGVMFLGGYKSSMAGSKAQWLSDYCRQNNRAYLRFDYTGHGISEGRFEEGSISSWRDDAEAMLDLFVKETGHKVLLVGSSMGGWIASLLALKFPEKVAGLITIAAACEFPTQVVEPNLTAAHKKDLAEKGYFVRETQYEDGPARMYQSFIEDARQHKLFGVGAQFAMPTHHMHGTADDVIPWELSKRLFDEVGTARSNFTLIKGGDHRLSTPQDLRVLEASLNIML